MITLKKIIIICIVLLGLYLRVFNLSNNPPSLNWDEASLGYNAYSILNSGKDEYGEIFPIARFIAFGDYKPPGYIYATVIPIAVLGLNEYAIRIPSLVAGLILMVTAYLISKELFGKTRIAALSMFLMAISPWGIHFSRGAFEANLAASLNALAVYCFLKIRKSSFFLMSSIILFVLSFYTFNANRIIAPVFLLTLCILYRKEVLSQWKWLIFGSLLAIVMLAPSMHYLTDRESKVRFQEVSIFNNLNTVVKANNRINVEGGNLIAKIMHNRRVLYSLDFLKHYTDNLNFRFLFTHGDGNPRLSVTGLGLLYPLELPFIFIGLLWLIKNKKRQLTVLSVWVIIALIPAGTAKETPHALRIISVLPVFQIIGAMGIGVVFKWVKTKYPNWIYVLCATMLSAVIASFIMYFLHIYMVHYPIKWAGQWQYGYKQMVKFVNENKQKYNKIYVTEDYGRPYIYFALYTPYNTNEFLKAKKAQRDWFGFWNVDSLDNIYFGIPESGNIEKNTLIVESKDHDLPANTRILNEIREPNGTVVFRIAEIK